MICRTLSCLVLLLGIYVPALNGQARIRIALDLKEPNNEGVLQSAFAAALRSLGDVDIVTPREDPDYVLTVVAVCDDGADSCRRMREYAVSISLSEPFSKIDAYAAARFAVDGPLAPDDERVQAIASHFVDYSRTHSMWVALWGKDRYEQAVRELVASVDSRCLDRTRIIRRLLREKPSASLADLKSLTPDRDWLC